MSKGSNSRPLSVPREQFDAAFDSIFKKRTPEERAKDELGPFVPLSSGPYGMMFGDSAEGDVLVSRNGVVGFEKKPD